MTEIILQEIKANGLKLLNKMQKISSWWKALKKGYKITFVLVLIAFSFWLFSLPEPLFETPYSTIVLDKNQQLVGAKIAKDGQWRFPKSDSIPEKVKIAIKFFEDEYFNYHPGFNPVAIAEAFWHNSTSESRRGGSTISQQLIRLSRQNPARNYAEKFIELVKSTRLEARYSKDEILNLYLSHAPFGGNVVGIDAASWRYFGIPAEDLSWGQAASLAVLPNAPSLVFPGKNEITLRKKRDLLLLKLHNNGIIDEVTYELSKLENLPAKPKSLPNLAPHFLEMARQKNEGENIHSTIDSRIQKKVNRIVEKYYQQYSEEKIYNFGVVVMNIETESVLAYVGNSNTNLQHQKFVDNVQSSRSTGSLLKPFLYAAMLDDGQLLPEMMVPDVPTAIANYRPENFTKQFKGIVAADDALTESLNIPAVLNLKSYGLERFYTDLKRSQLKGLDRNYDNYGLTLILGGAESSLWELTKLYSNFAKNLNFYNENSSQYPADGFGKIRYKQSSKKEYKTSFEPQVFSAGATYLSLEALKNLKRPASEVNWQYFESAQKISWKTGTSYGHKDAWSIGVNSKFAVGVWVGNSNGEGRAGLTGVSKAAPVMFDVFKTLDQNEQKFQKPFDDLVEIEVCETTGFLKSINCPKTKQILSTPKGQNADVCPYHKMLTLDEQKAFQVNIGCAESQSVHSEAFLVLPPKLAYYYKNPDYRKPPPFHPDCVGFQNENLMDFINLKPQQTFILPKNLEETYNEIIIKVAHQNDTEIHWYLDGEYLKTTSLFHEIALLPNEGDHKITAIDESGREISRTFSLEISD
ncbi:penicillin-binding protein 1C [Psychroflexus aestuariivivens]|uniref:penicillin-binding protein 1C n=1 Tax=Psychroflexus aestuariivivens TaxID=1795040 RepID=UPI001F02C03B|nr:penicillin-binding protein 1C [Psychroflexus aestuariivivens]